MCERPLRTKEPKPKIEENAERRAATTANFVVPNGEPAFREGFRECLEVYAIHTPNRRGVLKILDDHQLELERACVAKPTRENYARYEGFRAALKQIRGVTSSLRR